MRTKAFAGAALAVLAAGAIATPTFAQGYYGYGDGCRVERHDNGTAGAVVGGLLGAMLGSSVAPHHANRAGGAAIGAVAGALIGNSIARSGSSCDEGYNYAYAQPAYGVNYGYAYRGGYDRDRWQGDYDRDRDRWRGDEHRYDHDRYDRDRHDRDGWRDYDRR